MFCPLPPSHSRSRPWQRLLWSVLALAALVIVGRLVRSQISLRDSLAVGAKLEYFLQHRADYNVIFVGHSLIYRGVIPAVFDARMAERGYTTRSFNLAAGGMRDTETDQLVRYLLRTGEPPEHVVLGRVSSSARILSWELRTWRAVAWHTPRNTVVAARAVWMLDEPWTARLRLAARHVSLCGQWLTTFAGGPRILRHWRSVPRSDAAFNQFAASGGHQDLESMAGRHFRQRRRRFLRDRQKYVNKVERNRRRHRPVGRRTASNLQSLVGLAMVVAEAGASPVLLISPNAGGFAHLDTTFAGDIPVFNFDRPDLYPDLFDPELRFDRMHLSRAGAEIQTLLLADAFADLLAGRSAGGAG